MKKNPSLLSHKSAQPVRSSLQAWAWVGKIVLLTGLVIGLYGVLGRWWVVKRVECWGNGQRLSESACAVTQTLQDQPLMWLDLAAPRWSKITVMQDDQHRWWYLTGWAKQLPHTLLLTYTQSQPAYQLTQDNQAWWLINEAGLGQTIASPSANLQVIVEPGWSEPLITDLRVDPKLHLWILAAQKAVQVQPEPLQRIKLIDQFAIELQWATWSVLLTPDQEPQQQLARLRQVQSTLTDTAQTLGKDFHQVDLRFRLPVLRPSIDL